MDPFKNDDISVLEYNKILHQKYGNECLTWDPEILYARIDQDFHNWTQKQARGAILANHETGVIITDIHPVARNKIQALIMSVTTDFPFKEWELFEKVGESFCSYIPHFGVLQPLTPGQCAKTVILLKTLRGDDFSEDVKKYIAIQCYEDGFVLAPPTIEFIQPYLDSLGNDILLKNKVKIAVGDIPSNGNIRDLSFDDEDAVGVQLSKILSVELYAQEKL